MPIAAAPPAFAPSTPPAAPPAAAPKPAAAPPPAAGASEPPPSIRTPEGRRSAIWDSVRADLGKAANMPPADPPATPPAKPAAKPATPPATPPADAPTPPAEGQPAPAAGDQPPAGKGKASPWKLMDQFKKRALELEAEMAELRKRALPEDQWKQTQERLTAAEQRVKDYEDEIRFANYQKSPEFKEKYQAPYEKAWAKAMADLSSVTVTDDTGNVRKFSPDDMLSLVNLDLAAAHKLASELYGELAPQVMMRRDKIVDAHEAMAAALDDAKKNGATREAQHREQFQKRFAETSKFVSEAFDKANEAIRNNPKHAMWLKPTEGDEEGNAALEKGFAFALDAFSAKPLDPKLSPEQRAEAVRKHAALFNRAAAYPRLKSAVAKRDARIAELEEKLKAFEGSVPGNGSPAGGGAQTPPNARSQVFSALRKLAH